MTHTQTIQGRAVGPAVGVTSVGLAGPVKSVKLPSGKYIGVIAVKVRSRLLSKAIRPGQVFVEVVIMKGNTEDQAAPIEGVDVMAQTKADWASGSYIWQGFGATWHPNLFINEESEGDMLLLRVWNRDDLQSTIVEVDVAVTVSSRPVGGNDSISADAWCVRTLAGANPAAGVEPSLTCPNGIRWKLVAARTVLVTDGTAPSRFPQLYLPNGTTFAVNNVVNNGIPLNSTYNIVWYVTGLQAVNATALIITAPLADQMVMDAGDVLTTATTNLAGADDYQALRVHVMEQVVPYTTGAP